MSAAIRTNVGLAADGDNLFRGYSMRDDLAGRDGSWSLLSLAVGGPRLGSAEVAFFDDMAVCMLAADPRIWAIKIAWLLGSYGSAFAAAAGAQVHLEHARIGAWLSKDAAQVLRELRPVSERGERAILAWLADARARGRRIAGFGVPGRKEDERIALLESAVARHQRSGGVYYRTFRDVTDTLRAHTRLRPNMASAVAACALDLGLEPEQLGLLAHVAGSAIPLWANAVEAARLCPSSLRALPAAAIRYDGPPPRPSPRTARRNEP